VTAGLARDAAARRRDYEAWLQRMAGAGHGADFYQVLRRIDAAHPDKPRLGQGLRPGDEAVRIVQPADLTFAPTPVAGIRVPPGGGAVHLRQRIFGLIGPNGALPIHLTELARERAHHHGDHALQRFLDMLAQRFAVLFYRAWADAQPLLSMDRGGDTAFARRLGALVGIGEDSLLARDAAGDAAKLHFAGRLSRQVRDADGLQNWCRVEFDVPVQVQQWQGHWMPLGVGERTRLGRRAGTCSWCWRATITSAAGRARVGRSWLGRSASSTPPWPTRPSKVPRSASFCKLRGNPYVELVHWIVQMVQNNDTDLAPHHLRHYQLDVGAGQGHHGHAGPPAARAPPSISDLSEHIETPSSAAGSTAR
jgi:type VI secretion system ImpH/TssG family protein